MGFDVVKAGIRKLTEPSSLDRLITRVKQHPQSPRIGGRLTERVVAKPHIRRRVVDCRLIDFNQADARLPLIGSGVHRARVR